MSRRPAVVVRAAGPADLEAVAAVGRAAWPPTYLPVAGEDYVRRGLARWWTPEACRPAVEAGLTLVASFGEDVVDLVHPGHDRVHPGRVHPGRDNTGSGLNDPGSTAADGGVVGVAVYGVAAEVATLWKLYVHPEAQGRGVGSALLAAVAEGCRAGCTILRLEVVEGNDGALGFYLGHGFRPTGRQPGVFDGPDEIWLQRPLD